MERLNLVDTHCHLDMLLEDEIQESVREVSLLVTVGCDKEEIEKAIALVNRYENVFASVGFHPYEADSVTESDIEALSPLIENSSKVIAVGETGLDFYRNNASKKNQYKCFLLQIELSKKHKLPIIIHSREANRETGEIIINEDLSYGVMHCFGGDYHLLKTALDRGLYISFAGNVTYPKADNLRDMLKKVPLDRLLLETDSPYLSPQKVRGQKNKPLNVKYTYQFVSQYLNLDIEILVENVYNNTKDLLRRCSV